MHEGQNSDFGGLANNSGDFGSQNFAGNGLVDNRSMGYGVGDVILASDKKPKSKKAMVFAIIMIIVILCGVILFLLFKNGIFNHKSELVKSFNEYANLLLYGEKSENQIGENKGLDYLYFFDKQDLVFAIDEQQENEIKEYYKKLSSEILDFIAIANDFEEYQDDALSFFLIKQIQPVSEEEIRLYFLENGLDNTRGKINDYYAFLVNSNYNTANNLGEILVEAANYYLSEFNAYYQVGCTDDIFINYQCPVEVSFDYDAPILELETAVEVILNNTREKVLEGCFEINEIIE